MRKIKMIMLASMMCVLFQGCPFDAVVFGTVTPTSYRPTSDAGDDNDTTFTFDFEIISTSDLRVWERVDSTGVQTLKTETTHYSVTATNLDFTSGGTVTMVTAPATGVTLVIGRVIPYDQGDNFTDGDVISFASITNALDAVTLKVQQLEEMLNRAGLNPETDDTTLDMTYPSSIDRASQSAGWNASGEWTIISSGIAAGDATVTAYAETFLDDNNEAEFKATTNLEIGTDVQAWDAQLDDIAALPVTNGNFMVGDGSNWVAESGATALTSIGGQPLDAGLTSISGLTTAADKMPYTTASDTYAVTPLTSFARTLLDDADASTARATLGVGGYTDRGDPASEDFAVGDLTTDNTWRDLDLSSIVTDSTATAVLLRVQVTDDATSSIVSFRENGNTNTINVSHIRTIVANSTIFGDKIVSVDSSRIIEYRTANLTFTAIDITVAGWWH